jgi:hypothetical protein
MSDVLVEALATLRSSLNEFSREVPLSSADPAQRLKALRAVVQSIGYERPFKPTHCPDEYRKQWRDFVAGRRVDLERAAVRFLCWEPETATDARFHE